MPRHFVFKPNFRPNDSCPSRICLSHTQSKRQLKTVSDPKRTLGARSSTTRAQPPRIFRANRRKFSHDTRSTKTHFQKATSNRTFQKECYFVSDPKLTFTQTLWGVSMCEQLWNRKKPNTHHWLFAGYCECLCFRHSVTDFHPVTTNTAFESAKWRNFMVWIDRYKWIKKWKTNWENQSRNTQNTLKSTWNFSKVIMATNSVQKSSVIVRC